MVSLGVRTPEASQAQLVKWMGINDSGAPGRVHGGVIMKLCDEVAGLAAIKHAGTQVVTAGFDRMSFLYPVMVGEVVTVKASVNAAFNTSMEVGVRVESESLITKEKKHTSSAYLTMVALEDGKPTKVPALELVRPDDKRREREAGKRRANRLKEREELLKERECN